MQTFLPYPDLRRSAKVLDDKRLGKQRVEVLQILNVIARLRSGSTGRIAWAHHPAVEMWQQHPEALAAYGVAICEEWIGRGFKDTCREKISDVGRSLTGRGLSSDTMPEWFGDERLHALHRSSLLAKNPAYYGRFGWEEPDDLPSFWPTRGIRPYDGREDTARQACNLSRRVAE